MMKKLVCLFFAVLLLAGLGATAFADSGSLGVTAGEPMPDFTVSLTDGTDATLSELLKGKDLVVLNIFSSQCSPCEREFPEMESVYRDRSDRMVILAVSDNPADTMEIVSRYKAGHSLSFPMGLMSDDLDFLNVSAFPTTVFVDRSGNVGFVKVGAFSGREDFEAKVDHFLSPDYDGKPLSGDVVSVIMFRILAGLLVLMLLLVAARWLLFRKAGMPGWHSLIPFLSTYREFDLCWNGWFGLLSVACLLGIVAVSNLPHAMDGAALAARLVLGAGFLGLKIAESLKLARAFGKKTGAGILLWIFGAPARLILGLSRAQYAGKEA